MNSFFSVLFLPFYSVFELGMECWRPKLYKVYINDDHELTLTSIKLCSVLFQYNVNFGL